MENLGDFSTFEARLASFKVVQKKRASTTGSRGTKTIKWPHPNIAPESLAKAGWIYQPHPEHPDQVVCFLCRKGLDGWEKGDDPLVEHVKHAPNCGWAILAAIEAEYPDYLAEDPKSKRMIDARKSTFVGRWPHEAKKGWKCKTKQLAEAGWKYTPTSESDDMATCAYCQLMLDGWEPSDKPLEEHFNRSPQCLFFNFVDTNPAPAKKSVRGKPARASKASRMSVQSTGMSTFISEGPSTLEAPAEHEDSVMTTASKRGRPKKATTTAKAGRKTRTKKELAESEDTEITISEDMPPPPIPAAKGRKSRKPANDTVNDSMMALDEDELAAAPKPKRGKKRTSDAVEDSVLTTAEAPAPKRRTIRAKAAVVEAPVAQPEDDVSDIEPPAAKKPAPRKKGRASAKSTRKASGTSLRSTASTASLRAAAEAAVAADEEEVPDDAEIERQLVADLERPLSDDEDMAMDSDSERRRNAGRVVTKQKAKSSAKDELHLDEQGDYAMFDPSPVIPDEAEVNAELERIAAEVQADEPEPEATPEKLEVPKKGRKAGTRKVSKQTKKAKAAPEPEPEPEHEPELEEEPELEPEPVVEPEVEPTPARAEAKLDPEPSLIHAVEPEEESAETSIYEDAAEPAVADRSRISSGAVVKGRPSAEAVKEEEPAPAKRGRGRPPKKRGSRGRSSAASAASAAQRNSLLVKAPVPTPAPAPEPEEEVLETVEAPFEEEEAAVEPTPFKIAETDPLEDDVDSEPELVVVPSEEQDSVSPVAQRPLPPIPSSVARFSHHAPPSTPGSSAVPARNGVLSPSQSPQSSDAENQPPSSRPAKIMRPVLAPVVGFKASTPNRILNSPTKRTMVSTLQTTTPWTAADIDLVLGSPEKKRTAAGPAADGDKENSAARLLRKGAELTSPEKKMTVEQWIYHNASLAEEELKTKCESLVGKFEGEGMRAMRALEGLVVE